MFKLQIAPKILERRKNMASYTRPLVSVLTGLAALFSSNVQLAGSLSPFGVSLAAALPSEYAPFAAAGGILGYSVLGNFEENLPYIIALLAVLALKFAIAGRPRIRSAPAFLGCCCGLVLAVSLTVRNVLTDGSAAGLLLCLGEAVLGGTVTFFIIIALRGLPAPWGLIPSARALPKPAQTVSLLIGGMVVMTGMCSINLGIFNFGRILAVFFLLAAANRRGSREAAVLGLSFAAAFTLSSAELAPSGGIFAFCAMLAGLFTSFGRVTQATVFLLSGATGILLTGGEPRTIAAAFDLMAGAVCFLAFPQRFLARVKAPAPGAALPQTEGGRIAAELEFSALTLKGIRESVDAVSQKLSKAAGGSVESVYERVSERVCRRCGLKLFCWETSYNQTQDAFARLTPLLKANGRISAGDLPPFFKSKCAKEEELLQAVNGFYHEFLSHEQASRRVLGAKQVAAEQLEGISLMLSDAAREIEDTDLSDPQAAQKAKDLLTEIGEEADAIYCTVDEAGRMKLSIYRKDPFQTDRAFLAEQLSELLGRPFDLPCTVTAGEKTRICFFEKARYTLSFAAAGKSAGENRVSGDCYEYFAGPDGYAHMVLSDGMGTGGRAAVDAIMTCNFIMKLIKAGFGFDAALKFINSALLTRAGGESLATIDIACIDLYTGRAQLLKAGGAASFLCQNGVTKALEAASLPAGILQGISYQRKSFRLREGDLLVMVSDGAIPVSEEWICEEITAMKDRPPKEIAEKLVTLARHRQSPPGDDITVMAARMCLNP